ncbi:Abi family protein [Reichenbachiella ulvae]|uniref:Abi family protein n=1 Tax=Reichenbachiella ulvae TaxID=2980104 RepID=A0ABT3CZK2_9BACT|nr:Abi family protein [Reichenbachiella ulvae]MCV9389141.1 Abi family protein [Reichenbachiella ulvae]
MRFRNEAEAPHFLQYISYYRLKGYWWDTQSDRVAHTFQDNIFFEDIIERYNFDRHLRLILFDAIERIEVALRTQMIYHLSLAHGSLWYLDANLFSDPVKHANNLTSLMREFGYSQEIFIKDHKNRHGNADPDAWKIMEIVSMGTLSKFYKLLQHNLPAKSAIAKGLGLNLHTELSSWLEAITYVRNIVAHHSRLYSRDMVKRPMLNIRNPQAAWLNNQLTSQQQKKVFLIISCMLYICNKVTPGHQIKQKIKELIRTNPSIPVYKFGFLNDWNQQDLWR